LIAASFASAPLLQKKTRESVFVCRMSFREADLRLGHVDIRGVPQEARLLDDRLAPLRVRVPHRDGGDPADEVQVALAVRVEDVRAFAAHERDGLGAVVLEERLLRSVDQLSVAHEGRILDLHEASRLRLYSART
jgi:hypothetical protein